MKNKTLFLSDTQTHEYVDEFSKSAKTPVQ